MTILFSIREGFRDIGAHKLRSFLTALGVVLGVSSLMTMFAVTAGMADSMRNQLLNTGDAEKIHLGPAAPPPAQREIAERSPGLTYRDVVALRQASPLITWVSPVVGIQSWVSHRDRGLFNRVVGAEYDYLAMDRLTVEHGRFLTAMDQAARARVAVIGSRYWKELFPEGPASALGKTINVRGVSFTVVGTFPEYITPEIRRARELGITRAQQERRTSRGGRGREWDPYPWKNQVMAIPLTTMVDLFKTANMVNGVDQGPDEKLDFIQVGVGDSTQKSVVAEQIANVLRQTHRGIEDVEIRTHEAKVGDIEAEVRATRLSGGIIAGIGLIVGGLGICNIMLASIIDRMRELGVRIALGAGPSAVFFQVLVEAFLLALLGGLAGIAAGWGMVYLLDGVLRIPNRPILEPAAVGLSFAFAMATGILAGLYPAFRASRLKPVQALKFE